MSQWHPGQPELLEAGSVILTVNIPVLNLLLGAKHAFALVAITGYHRPDGLKKGIYFLIVLEARSPRSRCQQGLSLVKPLLLACRWLPFAVSSHVLSFVWVLRETARVSLSYKDIKSYWILTLFIPYCLFFFPQLSQAAYGILVPWPGIESVCMPREHAGLTTGPPGKSPSCLL